MSVKRKAVCAAAILACAVGCVREVGVNVAQIDYPYESEQQIENGARRMAAMIDPKNAQLALRTGCTVATDEFVPIFRILHTSDVQLRDSGVSFFQKGRIGDWERFLVDLKAPGTKYIKGFTGHDELPYLALVGAVNQMDANARPDLMIHTGDAGDTATRGELMQFILASNLLNIPWLSVMGNHDVLLFGNLEHRGMKINDPSSALLPSNSRLTVTKLHGRSKENVRLPDALQDDPESVNLGTYRHGYDWIARDVQLRPQQAQPQAYYSMLVNKEHKIRLISLDTALNDEIVGSFTKWQVIHGAGQEGRLTEDEFDWLDSELTLAENAGEIVIIAAHHPIDEITISTDPDKKRFKTYIEKQAHVVAFLSGHTHRGAIHTGTAPGIGKYVEVVAPSMRDFPQQASLVTLYSRKSDGRLAVQVQPVKGRTDGATGAFSTSLDDACRLSVEEDHRAPGTTCWIEDKTTCSDGLVLVRDGVLTHKVELKPPTPDVTLDPNTVIVKSTRIEGKVVRIPNGTHIRIENGSLLTIVANTLEIGDGVVVDGHGEPGAPGPAATGEPPPWDTENCNDWANAGSEVDRGLPGGAGLDGGPGGNLTLSFTELIGRVENIELDLAGGAGGPGGPGGRGRRLACRGTSDVKFGPPGVSGPSGRSGPQGAFVVEHRGATKPTSPSP